MSDAGTVGFVGLGNMGRPMAANLAHAGIDLIVHDAEASRATAFAKEFGVRAADGLVDLGQAADIVVTMLPTGAIVRSVLLEQDGGALAKALGHGALLIDMSSSEPIGTRALGEALAAHGITLVDAPVSGGVAKAEDGTLAIMIGGDDEAAVARAEPVLSTMGDRLFRAGPLGTGHAVKALNNFIAAASFTAAAEALIIGQRFGLDPERLVEIVNNSTGRSFNTEIPIKEHVLPRSFATGFQLGLMAKDVGIAGDFGEAMAVDAPLSRMLRTIWADARDAIGGEQDFTAAVTHWEAKNAAGEEKPKGAQMKGATAE